MTYKNTKPVSFTSLIITIILPFFVMDSSHAAPLDDPKYLGELLAKMTPYITIQDDGQLKFDKKEARENGFDKKDIRSAKKIVKEQNTFVRGEITEPNTISTYFQSGELQAQSESQAATTSSVCNWDGQASTPSRYDFPTNQNTLESAKSLLIGIGYHNVADYAKHPDTTHEEHERSFQKNVFAHGCESGVFRTEAFLEADGETYRYFSPEPNPEILDSSYSWPVWYWPLYVADWHDNN